MKQQGRHSAIAAQSGSCGSTNNSAITAQSGSRISTNDSGEKEDVSRVFRHDKMGAKSGDSKGGDLNDDWVHNAGNYSFYHASLEESSKLGKGGQGVVVEVMHRSEGGLGWWHMVEQCWASQRSAGVYIGLSNCRVQ